MSTFPRKAVAAAAVLMLVLCGSVLVASGAQASPPRYAAVKAGPSLEYPMIGFYDTQAPVLPQCWDTDSSNNTWVLVATNGVLGYALDTPFSGVHREPDTPQCEQPSAACTNSPYQNSIVQWDTGGWRWWIPNTSWYVGHYCHRQWIPNTTVWMCLWNQGVPDLGVQTAAVLDSLPDSYGNHITCIDQVPAG